MLKIKNLFANNSYLRNIAVLASGTLISHALMILTLPILSRLYTPEMFGVLTVYMSSMGIISVMAAGKYELAILNPKSELTAYNIAYLSIIILLFFSFFGTLIAIALFNFKFLEDNFHLVLCIFAGTFFTTL
jgi:O-antigen/teichoic acid export membrane protein